MYYMYLWNGLKEKGSNVGLEPLKPFQVIYIWKENLNLGTSAKPEPKVQE